MCTVVRTMSNEEVSSPHDQHSLLLPAQGPWWAPLSLLLNGNNHHCCSTGITNNVQNGNNPPWAGGKHPPWAGGETPTMSRREHPPWENNTNPPWENNTNPPWERGINPPWERGINPPWEVYHTALRYNPGYTHPEVHNQGYPPWGT